MEAISPVEASLANSSSQRNFEIVTAIRSDGLLGFLPFGTFLPPGFKPSQFYMQEFHRDRMLAAADAFNWPQKSREVISNFTEDLSAHLEHKYKDSQYASPLKLRVIVVHGGTMKVTSAPIPAVELACLFPASLTELFVQPPVFRIYVSPVSTSPSLFTSHKTTKREQYDIVRALMPNPSQRSERDTTLLLSEILLVNNDGNVMEGSYTTPYFLREGKWITPTAESGGNLGTTRRYALTHGICKEDIIVASSVQLGERVVLSNGVKGFAWGSVEKLDV